jgi:hypothetical protein
MTTIIAIRASDGLVMASDLQETSQVKEYTSKIKGFGKNELLGCAGASPYISVFQDHIQTALAERGNEDYRTTFNKGIDSFSVYLSDKITTQRLDRFYTAQELADFYPQGIFAVVESEYSYRIFEFDTPHPCTEILPGVRERASAGSGARPAQVFMQVTEKVMIQSGIPQTWRRFSSNVIRQYCQILIERIADIDPYSQGLDIQVLTPSGSRGITEADPVFPKYRKPYTTHFAELLENIFDELGSPMPAYMAGNWGLLPLLDKLGLRFGSN